MTPAELPFGTITRLPARIVAPLPPPAELVAGAEVTLRQSTADRVNLHMAGGSRTAVTIEATGQRAARSMADLLASPWPRLTAIEHCNGADIVLAAHEFTARLHWPASMRIGITEPVLAELRGRMQRRDATAAEVALRLAEELLLPAFSPGGELRCLMSAGIDIADPARPFRMHGAAMSADIRRDDDGCLTITRVMGKLAPAARVVLVEADIGFAPLAELEPLSPVARGQLATLTVGTDQYLRLWTQYAELDRKRLTDRAREIGAFRYQGWEATSDGSVRFTLARPDSEALANLREAVAGEEIALQAAQDPPGFLSEARAEVETPAPPPRNKRRRRPRMAVGQVTDNDIDGDGRWIALRPARDGLIDAPPRQGYLSISQFGSEIAMSRREQAHEAIRRGTAPMRQLGLLLEGQPLPFPPAAGGIPSLSRDVVAILGGQPTDQQKLAVEIAVNTPDLAVIQGPPGTGKTQVIAAIVKRLEELADPDADPVGLFLITSYQHVAVENVAERVQPFGLPALKLGRSRREAAETTSTTRTWVERNIPLLREEMARADDNRQVALLRELRERLQRYINGHHLLEETAEMLEATAALAVGLVPLATANRLRQLAACLRQEVREQTAGQSPARDRAYRAAYALRYVAAAFEDDGRQTADALVAALQAANITLAEADQGLLRDARKPGQAADPGFLVALGRLRERLLRELAPDRRPVSVRMAPRTDVADALADVVGEARTGLAAGSAGLALVLDDYLGELERNEWRVRNALAQYTAARAETCQGCAGIATRNTWAAVRPRGFETVIIDEAARANPLDLLIPMAQARRRIILVGDHKQLPHVLEPDIETEMTKTLGAEAAAALRTSLFERLFASLQDRAVNGEVRRTVTLDRQFRMHSALGNFVSEVFYANAVGSDLQRDRDLAHGLEMFTKDGRERVAVWIDVAAHEGPSRRGRSAGMHGLETPTKSKTRPAEVPPIRFVVGQVRERRPGETIGVISFYKDQVLLLRRQLAAHADYVHVGTVDELQGREYPVVLLSMTRSNNLTFTDPRRDAEPQEVAMLRDRAARLRFGFLMLENRMCVALSRQKRLLVVVGDRRMLSYPEAEFAVRPLVAFDRLCGGDFGMRLEWIDDDLRVH
jgi:hypothetical protein